MAPPDLLHRMRHRVTRPVRRLAPSSIDRHAADLHRGEHALHAPRAEPPHQRRDDARARAAARKLRRRVRPPSRSPPPRLPACASASPASLANSARRSSDGSASRDDPVQKHRLHLLSPALARAHARRELTMPKATMLECPRASRGNQAIPETLTLTAFLPPVNRTESIFLCGIGRHARTSPSADNLASEILALIGRDGSERASVAWGSFRAAPRKKQLLDCAARLGLKGVSKLSTRGLAGRIQVAFAGLAGGRRGSALTSGAGAVGRRRARERRRRRSRRSSTSAPSPTPSRCPRTFPGATARTASPRWPSIRSASTSTGRSPTTRSPRARAGLGAGGERAWLNLRVYDITGRLFDGTNAHSYFDHRVERHDRQWFFVIDKPTSTACVEVGLKSEEGYFVKIARSGRVDFPRREPVGGGAVEWLSVRGATGPVGNRVTGAPAPDAAARTAPVRDGGGGRPAPGGGGGRERPRRRWQDWTQYGGLPGPARPARCSGDAGSGRKASPSSGPASGRRPSGPARCCAPSGSRARSPTRSTFPRAASRSRTTARSRSARKAGARTSCTGRGRS